MPWSKWFGLALLLGVPSMPMMAQAQVTAGSDGVTIRSNDDNLTVRIGLDIQIDSHTFPGESAVTLRDEILLRRARPTISGTAYKYVDFYIRPDFGEGVTVLYDAYVELKYFPRANL